MADIHAIQTHIKKHNLLTVALLIPLFAGCALRESNETLGGIVFVLSIALMVLGFISGRDDEKRLPAYWAKYQQIHRMDNLLRANLVGVWLCAEARVAVYREGSGYRVQLDVLDGRVRADGRGFRADDGRGVSAISGCASNLTKRVPHKST